MYHHRNTNDSKRNNHSKQCAIRKNRFRNGLTFSRVAQDWLLTRRDIVKPSTYALYSGAISKHILPALGNIRIDQISNEQLEFFFRNKLSHGRLDGTGGLSAKSVSDLRGVIKLILEYAYDQALLDRHITLPKIGGYTPAIETFSHAEQALLESKLFAAEEPFALGIILSLYGGLRIGEVCALTWDDIHFDVGTVAVQKTLIRIQDTSPNAPRKTKLILETPKTPCSNRVIPLPEFVLAHLRAKRGLPGTYVLSGTLHFVEPRCCLGKYKRFLKSAGVADHTYHALRHTFATRCIENNVDVKSLSEIMGHASVTITMQRYVHPSMDLKRAQINKLTPIANLS